MAVSPETVKARIILQAVQFAAAAQVDSLHQLIARETDVLQLELVLRILLTYLPESTEPTLYIDLLQQLGNGNLLEPPQPSVPSVQPNNELSAEDARHQARQLHLLALAETQDLHAGCTDHLSLFLIHRARKIDTETGSVLAIQQLLEPFIDRDPYLRTWTISNILPLRRLDYEYYPPIDDPFSLEAFEKLEGRPAIDSLLSPSARAASDGSTQSARDLRGIVGPWLYGERSRKRRKTHHGRRRSSLRTSRFEEQDTVPEKEELHTGWSDVNDWILDLALRDFSAAANTIEQWDGPNDVDYDAYGDDEELDHDIHGTLAQQYAQAGLATVFVASGTSTTTFQTCHAVIRKTARLLGLHDPPALEGAQESSDSKLSRDYLDKLSEIHLLHNALLRPDNPLTFADNTSITFASLVIRSCILFQRLGHAKTCKAAAALVAFGRREEHMEELHKTLQKIPVRTRDNGSWAEVRQQILWLRDWQYEASGANINGEETLCGPFSKIKRVDVEVELLRALLRASCTSVQDILGPYLLPRTDWHYAGYTVAVHVYCTEDQHPVPDDLLETTVLSVAMSFYDGASNGNRTRGGVRKASEMYVSNSLQSLNADIRPSLAAFQSYFPASKSFSQAKALIEATHSMSFYSLTLQHGVPFQPVNIRASKDPMSLIGKILEQNPRSYTKLDDLIEIGQSLVKAGFDSTAQSEASARKQSERESPVRDQNTRLAECSRRITYMAIEASLVEKDFDTAYSYIINRLSPTVATSQPETSLTQEPADSNSEDGSSEDDISWRAAYLAGRSSTPKSETTLRRLEQRLELLSLALLLAPASHLSEMLQVWRAVESDLAAQLAREAAEEDRWDSKGDGSKRLAGSITLPGGFAPSAADTDQVANQKPRRQSRATAAAANEEAPMGLFDVARGAAQAFSKNAFPLRGAASATTSPVEGAARARPLSMGSDSGSDGKGERVRKRDLVANAVTGGLASGIGWVIGAPAPPKT
ncbi:MAG: hypothetical protein L6R40_005193 [Gallowayella cf. fulva]|nr:MAG: hypothetical protein L6R40_005193 [Xanthomendoza cf. fulva]